MKTLANSAEAVFMRARLLSLKPSDTPLWGHMTVDQMICHLTDAFRLTLGELTAAPIKSGIPRPIYKWLALRFPRQWPHDVPTTPEMKQGAGGTPPSVFAADLATLIATFHRFTLNTKPRPRHPFFGRMSAADWNRWAYLHTDHHLRQFGR